jgi:hypothetical protein
VDQEKTMADKNKPTSVATPTRELLIELLNQDLAREYQAIIAYVVYSQVLKGPEYMNIAKELEIHAGEELQHALIIAKQIDYLGGQGEIIFGRSILRRPLVCDKRLANDSPGFRSLSGAESWPGLPLLPCPSVATLPT